MPADTGEDCSEKRNPARLSRTSIAATGSRIPGPSQKMQRAEIPHRMQTGDPLGEGEQEMTPLPVCALFG